MMKQQNLFDKYLNWKWTLFNGHKILETIINKFVLRDSELQQHDNLISSPLPHGSSLSLHHSLHFLRSHTLPTSSGPYTAFKSSPPTLHPPSCSSCRPEKLCSSSLARYNNTFSFQLTIHLRMQQFVVGTAQSYLSNNLGLYLSNIRKIICTNLRSDELNKVLLSPSSIKESRYTGNEISCKVGKEELNNLIYAYR